MNTRSTVDAAIENMLIQRGVNVSNPIPVSYEGVANGGVKYDDVIVFIGQHTRIGEKNVVAFADITRELGGSRGIIVTELPNSETVINAVSNYSIVLQLFHYAQLYTTDFFSHRMVFPHRILSEEETTKMFEKFHISIEEITRKVQEDKIKLTPDLPLLRQLGLRHKEYMPMPYIWVQDPAARWIGARPGDVIEIMRKSETAGPTPYYRFCVANKD